MTTDTSNVEPAGREPPLPTDAVFELLLADRRRYALYCLSQAVGGTTLEDLVERVARREGAVTANRLDEITVSFQHNHLRKLVDSGVVRYDPETGAIHRRSAAGSLDPYLELAFLDAVHTLTLRARWFDRRPIGPRRR